MSALIRVETQSPTPRPACPNSDNTSKFSSNDYQATVLHLLGVDHSKLVFTHYGRAQRLTDGRPARVVKEILA